MAENKEHGTFLDAQSFFGFVVTAWTKVRTPTLDQLNAVRKIIDSNVYSTGIDSERGAWRRFDEKNTTKMDESQLKLIRTKNRLARDHEECTTRLKRKQSDAIEECKKEMKQNSYKAIAHLAEDTIGSFRTTVSRTFRVDMKSILREHSYHKE